MASLEATDLLLVQRGQQSYKFLASDLLSQVEGQVEYPETLNDLLDVDTSGVSDGQFLQYDQDSDTWLPVTVDMPNALEFKGTVDATVGSSAPDAPAAGDIWVNTGSGTVDASWTGANGSSVVGGEFIVYNAETGWQVLGRAEQPIGVTTLTVQNGIKEAANSTANDKVIELDTNWLDARYSKIDHVHPNATSTTDGFMSSLDKVKLDAATALATPNTLALRDGLGSINFNKVTAAIFDIDALQPLPGGLDGPV